MRKQLQLIACTAFMVLASLTGYGQQVGETFDAANGIKYQITRLGSPNTVMIIEYKGTATGINIPDTVTYQSSDFKVTSIRLGAFWKKQLESVTIPNGVTSIGGLVFAENNLTSVTIPNSVVIIGARAFQNNQLTSVTIPESVTDIEGQAFADNPDLVTVVLEPSTPPNLGTPDIGDAFTDRGTIAVVVPRGTLDDYKTAWTGFKSITEERDVGDTFTVEGITYEITALGGPSPNTVTITDNTNTGDLTISGTVTYGPNDFEVARIGDYAFQGNALTSVTLPESVTSIGGAAFTNNPHLVTVVLERTEPPSIEESTFEDRNQIDLVVPKDVLNQYKTAWGGFNFKSITGEKGVGETFTVNGITYEITVFGSPGPNTVTITDYQNQNTATSVNIPKTITYQGNSFEITRIGDDAFRSNALTSVDIPDSVTSIGDSAFQGNALTSVIIPESVETIDDWAFANNPGLTTVGSERTEPPSIEENTFEDRNQIAVIVPKDTETAYENEWGTGFKSIMEEGGVGETFTANGISYQVTSLNPRTAMVTGRASSSTATDITIPGTVANGLNYAITLIEGNAFVNNQLSSVTIGQNVTNIRSNAFSQNQLISVTIPGGVKSIGGRAFAENDLTNVTIQNGVERIEARAFQTNALTSVTIPESVTVIGGAAFADNQKLAIVVSEPSTPPNLGSYDIGTPGFTDAFTNPDQIDVIVPKDALNDYKTAWDSFNFKSITGEKGVGETFTVNGIAYEITAFGSPSPNTVTITGYQNQNTATSVNIPETITHQDNDFEVTRIGDDAFQDNALTSVDIPDSVTSIGDGAFQGNALTSVIIPNRVTSIGANAFANNPGLTTVGSERTDPPSIEENTFEDRNQIDVIVPKDALNHYKTAWGGFNFKSITGEGDVDETFTDNGIDYKITSLNPRTTMVTGRASSSTATDITIPGTVANGLNYAVTGIEENAFVNNQLSSITIGQNVTNIRSNAFSQNQLTSVIIPNRVTSIGANAFADNPGLTTVGSERTDPPSIEENTFEDRNQIDVIVPKGASNDYTTAWDSFNFKSITEEVVDGETFTDNGISYQVTSLNPRTVMVTGRAGSSTATDITIPGTVAYGLNYAVTGIEENAFVNNQLSSVTIGQNVASIGSNAFSRNKLTSVTIPESVTSIGFGAFSVCELSSVYIPEGATSIGESAFRGNKLTSVTIPSSVTSIGKNAFAFNKITRFTISSNGNGTSIGDGALCHNNLSSVTLPSSVTSIGQNAFKDNTDLATVVSKRTDPPSIQVGTFINAGRDKIDVFVPKGALNNYEDDAEWTGFNSITDGIGVSIEAPETTNLLAFTVTFQFDLDVTGFTVDDIDLDNATADNFTGSGSVYTVEITLTSCNGAVQIDIPANAAEYAPNFPNLAASTTITVNALPVTAIARDITVVLDASGHASITPEQVDNGSHGSCNNGPISLSLDRTDFSCDDIDSPVTVTLTATSGNNSATATAVIEVVDGMIPTAMAKDHTVQLDASGNASIQAGDINNGSSDNCGIETVTVSPSSFDGTDLGANTVSLTVTDSSGNSGTATAMVTVEAYPSEIGHVFTVSDMDYEIMSINPHTVTVTGFSGINVSGRLPAIPSSGAITIPETIIQGGITYIVTGIGDGAFEYSGLTNVTIGRNVTSIGENAFRGNQLTSLTIPESVTSIGDNAFTDNPLTSVLVLANTPPELNFYDIFSDPDTIELTVPVDRIDDYRAAGWTGFESISDGITLIIGEPEKDSFAIYPNPVRDKIHIDLGSGLELKQVNIYTTAGAYLYSENGSEINTGHLSKGMYLFEIVTKTGDRSIKKVIVQ